MYSIKIKPSRENIHQILLVWVIRRTFHVNTLGKFIKTSLVKVSQVSLFYKAHFS